MEKTAITTRLDLLHFRDITPADFGAIARFMELTDSRTCDYTLGGIVLWTRHFGYKMAVADDTLFILGGREDNLAVPAFALPLGTTDFSRSLERLREFCRDAGRDLWFSAIPEDRLHLFASVPTAEISELGREWSDYLYSIEAFATLEGGNMKKKRNHVHHFIQEHPDYSLTPVTEADAGECMALLRRLGHDDTPTGVSEYEAVGRLLANLGDYAPFYSIMALKAGGRIVGFTIGEPKADTLHVHVEKVDHTVSGANEALASLFAAEMKRRNPRLLYINRQDDAGTPGLRASKESWHPLRLLPKFNVRI